MRDPPNNGIVIPLHLSAEERRIWHRLLENLTRVIWDESKNGTDLRQEELYQKGRGSYFARKARG